MEEAASAEKEDFNYNCVVANDEHFQMMAVTYNLGKCGVKILHEGVNGLETLQFIQKNPKAHVDIILLDINMPIMGGMEACKKIIETFAGVNSLFKCEHNEGREENQIMSDIFKQPLMVAYSGLVNDEIR